MEERVGGSCKLYLHVRDKTDRQTFSRSGFGSLRSQSWLQEWKLFIFLVGGRLQGVHLTGFWSYVKKQIIQVKVPTPEAWGLGAGGLPGH